jgi:hypothetical protein
MDDREVSAADLERAIADLLGVSAHKGLTLALAILNAAPDSDILL